jgi:hypothetical protein
MKRKIIAVIALVELVLIVILAGVLITRFISIKETGPVVREPEKPGEARLAYTPPPPPKIPASTLQAYVEIWSG